MLCISAATKQVAALVWFSTQHSNAEERKVVCSYSSVHSIVAAPLVSAKHLKFFSFNIRKVAGRLLLAFH
jgi:hypothetical protein